ncbi:MAG: sigma-54 dependent transcriptional regulator [Methyloprofundus sp.]|nr:sigma-54 dependent transcriptional regulator [Methyloprofundus sp.]
MSGYKAKILVVDDEPDICGLVQEILQDEAYTVFIAKNAEEARKVKKQESLELILLDIWMPDTDGITLLKEWTAEADFTVPVIMMSGHATIDTAVDATKLGAYGFLEKPLSLARLLLTVQRAIAAYLLQRENKGLKQQLAGNAEPVGHSAFARQLREQLKRLAQYETNLMLIGEPGVGKEIYARFLHANGVREGAAFVELSLGQEHAEFELFGQELNGEIQIGALGKAQGGLLFLSEIEMIDADMQYKLFNALKTERYVHIGGGEKQKLNCRLVSSVTDSLREEVQAGRFRQDLYYLLNEVELQIEPLRKHVEDVPELLNFYIDFFIQYEKLAFRQFSMPALNFLRNYSWPGNVAELKNLVQRVMILGGGDEIELAEVEHALSGVPTEVAQVGASLDFFGLPLKEAREQFERSYLLYHFNENDKNVAKLAAAVGVERTHLYRKLHALNIKE